MSRQVYRVPMGFDWPRKEVWAGFLNPYSGAATPCPACGGSGYSREANRFCDEWYGNRPFNPAAYGATPMRLDHPAIVDFALRNVRCNPEYFQVERLGRDSAVLREKHRLFNLWRNQWCHNLIQEDVDALLREGRLGDFTHRFVPGEGWVEILPPPTVTAEQVNEWSIRGLGHDSTNEHICVRDRCRRAGVPDTCAKCEGSGETWPSRAHKELAESWQPIRPPEGPGWQMWEDTSEGSPISPVFGAAEDLARWLADTGANAGAGETATYEQWLDMINRGWAPSAVSVDGGPLVSGVVGLAELEAGS